jgi:phosphoglycerol transferase
MKLALLNAFPNLLHSAEREFIERCVAVLNAMGHEARSVVTSDDIMAFDPDAVIVTHEFAAKTTDHFTVGLLWSPTIFYKDDELRLKSIRSWDLAVPINAETRRLAKNLHFPLRHDSAVSDLDFYPSAPVGDLSTPDPSTLSLAYVGAHWDGQRHRQLLEELAKVTDLHVYGPAKAWEFMPGNYRGGIPFDGKSLVQTLNRHGVVLALHKLEHAQEQTPSMRVFEACAARCAVITERMPAFSALFGDDLHYIDTTQNPKRLAREIAAIVQRYRAEPALYEQTVGRVHEAFRVKASLEVLLSALLDEVLARKSKALAQARADDEGPGVSVIIRCGSRPLSVLQRAVASVGAQTHAKVGLILVRFAAVDGFEHWLGETRASGRFAFVTEVLAPGGGVRSAAWWAGLRAVRSEAFCLLDDDDELFKDHLSSLVQVLARDPDCDVAYSGGVKQEEDGVYLNHHDRFKGDLQQEIKERRTLQFMDDYNLDRMLRFDNFILSHAWLARSRVLTEDVLSDPDLEVGEDVYFYLLLATRCSFRFSGRVSVVWNWRSNAADNSMLAVSQQRWARCAALLSQRLAHVQFPGAFEGRDVIGVGRVPRKAWGAAAEAEVQARPVVPPARGWLSRSWVKHLLRAASGRQSFLSAAEPIPFDPADIVYTVDFTRAVLPAFIVNVRGLSDVEAWGCWTDGPMLKLEFRNPLPSQFTLHLIGHAAKANHELPITVSVGAQEATLRMSARLRASRYSLPVSNPDAARSLVFHIPNARSPAAIDSSSRETRRLGIGLVRLDIICQQQE